MGRARAVIVDELFRQPIDVTYPGGVRHSDEIAPVRARIDVAPAYLFERDAVAMAASVSLSKPSSILAALPWVRLPFPTILVEFENAHLREAMGALGSPLVRPPGHVVDIVRSGFLLTHDGDSLCVEYAHSDRDRDGRRIADVAPVLGRFDLRVDRAPTVAATGFLAAKPLGSGRLREYLARLASDPAEAAAAGDLFTRFSWAPHPDFERLRAGVVRLFAGARADPEAAVAAIEENQAHEAARLFSQVVLPALILLSTRNAVSVDRVEQPPKLVRARAGRGRRPPSGYSVVRLKLTDAQQRMARTASDGGRSMRSALVRGHFKVRKTGVFWWSMHARGGGDPPGSRDYTVGA
jgi:hypothetical protein